MADKLTNSNSLAIVESNSGIQKKIAEMRVHELTQTLKRLKLNREDVIALQLNKIDIDIAIKEEELKALQLQIASKQPINVTKK